MNACPDPQAPPSVEGGSSTAFERLNLELRTERKLRYALLAEQQTLARAQERRIERLEARLNAIRVTRWWRLRRWLIGTVSAIWWIEDHVD